MKINIVSVWTWFANILDTQNLSASEQLILVHLIKIFNRNFWKPTKVSNNALCRSCGKDARTVKRSLSLLLSAGYLKETEDGLFLNLTSDEELKKNRKAKITKNQPFVNKSDGEGIKPPSKYKPPERPDPKKEISNEIKRDIINCLRNKEAFSKALQAVWESLDPALKNSLEIIANQTDVNL